MLGTTLFFTVLFYLENLTPSLKRRAHYARVRCVLHLRKEMSSRQTDGKGQPWKHKYGTHHTDNFAVTCTRTPRKGAEMKVCVLQTSRRTPTFEKQGVSAEASER